MTNFIELQIKKEKNIEKEWKKLTSPCIPASKNNLNKLSPSVNTT